MNLQRPFLIVIFSFLFFLTANGQHFVFYFHGAIIENKGPEAVDSINGYGAYKYFDIVDSLRKRKNIVISEVRKPGTDVKEYAQKVARQVDSLLKNNVSPQNITVIGASKGSVIAMYVSTFLKNKDVNFVFMAACSDDLFASHPDIMFYGNILSIYEKSDMNGTCLRFKYKSTSINHYKEVALNTGLKHGFLYRPLNEWIVPVRKWINNNYE